MMIGVNDLLFPLFLGCIVSPVLIYLFCFFVFHLFLISDGFCYFENKKTKKKKKKKFTRRPFFFFFIHTIRWVKDDGGWQVLFIEKYHPEMPKQTQSFFCFFSKSLFFIRKKSFRLSKRDTQIGWVGWRPRPQRSVKWIPNGGKNECVNLIKKKISFPGSSSSSSVVDFVLDPIQNVSSWWI